MNHFKKKTWQEFARVLDRAREDDDLSISDMIDEYGYSRGKISCYLNLAAALKVYPELLKVEQVSEAIEFMRKKKFHRSLES